MKRMAINYCISLLLLLSLCITALLGLIQAQLELRKFVPHRYSAYVTLSLSLVHVLFNGGKLWRYFFRNKK